MIRALISLTLLTVGALPRSLRAALGDACDSRELARTVRILARQRAALEQQGMAQEHRADVAERRIENLEASVNVYERRAERAEDERDELRRQLLASEGAAAVQRAELASARKMLADNADAMDKAADEIERLRRELAAAVIETNRVTALIDSPEIHDFIAGVAREAAHQRKRWGSTHDAGKTPADWFWLVGYLAGKACSEKHRA